MSAKQFATRSEFLDLVKVIKMLYGRDFAEQFFAKNVYKYYDFKNESLSKEKD